MPRGIGFPFAVMFVLLSACVPVTSKVPSQATLGPTTLATLKTVVGEVQYRIDGLPTFMIPLAGDPLYAAGELMTGADAHALIEAVDGSQLYLYSDSSVHIGESGAFAFLNGLAWVAAADDLAVVNTPFATAALRGVLMSVTYDPISQTTTLTCIRGLCLLLNDFGETIIPAGQQASAAAGLAPALPQPVSEVDLPPDVPELAARLTPNSPSSANGRLAALLVLDAERVGPLREAINRRGAIASNTQPTSNPTSTPSLTPIRVTASSTPTKLPAPVYITPTALPSDTAVPTTAATAVPTALPTETLPVPTAPRTLTSTAILPPNATATHTFTPLAPTPSATVNVAGQESGPKFSLSPTWVLEYLPTPLALTVPSKLGFHVTGDGGTMIDFAAAAQPAVMKGVEEIAFFEGVKAVSPNTVTIGRYVVDQPNIGVGDPVQRAIDFVAEQLPRYQEHAAYVDYWEGWNEVAWPNYEWYGKFEATRACEMQKHGLRAAIGGFSAGTPEPWQFEFFLPAIEAGLRCGAILTLHEYGAPTMYMWWTHGLPPGPWYPDRGPLAGRYRWLYRDILIPRGLTIPLVISEIGIDGLVAMGLRPGPVGPGWLEFRDYWVRSGLTNDPLQFYVDQLIWYDSILRQDNYVIGGTIYTVGGGISPQQETYEAVSLVPLLIDYMQSLR